MSEASVADFDGTPSIEFTEPTTIRLISTAYIQEPAMRPLVDDEAELAILEELEARTSRRHDAEMPLPPGLKRTELLTDAAGYGWTYVNAAFCYTRPTGNRFNDRDRGAWYAAWGDDASETAQAEVAWHLTRELDNVGVYENVTACRELLAGFIARFADLRIDPNAPWLDEHPEQAYPHGQALARRLRAVGAPGVVYPSVRRPGGLCLAAFSPHLVQHIRQGATWIFTWSGDRTPGIEAA